MHTDNVSIKPTASGTYAEIRPLHTPKNEKEAARQFEELLIKQFVHLMLKDAFNQSLTGSAKPAWLETQQATQVDTLAEVLARDMSKRGLFTFSDLLLRQWQHQKEPSTNPDTHESSTP